MTRREHLRAWAREVIREGVVRGVILQDAPIGVKAAFLLAEAAKDLEADLGTIGGEALGALAQAGAATAHGALDRLLGAAFGAVEEKLRGGVKR